MLNGISAMNIGRAMRFQPSNGSTSLPCNRLYEANDNFIPSKQLLFGAKAPKNQSDTDRVDMYARMAIDGQTGANLDWANMLKGLDLNQSLKGLPFYREDGRYFDASDASANTLLGVLWIRAAMDNDTALMTVLNNQPASEAYARAFGSVGFDPKTAPMPQAYQGRLLFFCRRPFIQSLEPYHFHMNTIANTLGQNPSIAHIPDNFIERLRQNQNPQVVLAFARGLVTNPTLPSFASPQVTWLQDMINAPSTPGDRGMFATPGQAIAEGVGAHRELGVYGDSLVQLVEQISRNTQPHIRASLASGLASQRAQQPLPPWAEAVLERLSHDNEAEVRAALAGSLTHSVFLNPAYTTGAAMLERLSQYHSPRVRSAVAVVSIRALNNVLVLNRLASEPLAPALTAMLDRLSRDNNPGVRQGMAEAIHRLGLPTSLANIRHNLASELARLGDRSQMRRIIQIALRPPNS